MFLDMKFPQILVLARTECLFYQQKPNIYYDAAMQTIESERLREKQRCKMKSRRGRLVQWRNQPKTYGGSQNV